MSSDLYPRTDTSSFSFCSLYLWTNSERQVQGHVPPRGHSASDSMSCSVRWQCLPGRYRRVPGSVSAAVNRILTTSDPELQTPNTARLHGSIQTRPDERTEVRSPEMKITFHKDRPGLKDSGLTGHMTEDTSTSEESNKNTVCVGGAVTLQITQRGGVTSITKS